MNKTKTFLYGCGGRFEIISKIPEDLPDWGVDDIMAYYRMSGRTFDHSVAKELHKIVTKCEKLILENLATDDLRSYWVNDIYGMAYAVWRQDEIGAVTSLARGAMWRIPCQTLCGSVSVEFIPDIKSIPELTPRSPSGA